MKIEQLSYFIEIVKCKNFSIASDNLYISQSSLSKQIKKLENELSTTLFNRSTRSIELTPSGNILYFYANNILEQHQKLKENIKDYTTKNKNRINLISIPIISQYGLFDMINDFEKNYPDIHINIIEIEMAYLIKYLGISTNDLIIMRTNFVPINSSYKIYPIIEDELVVITNKNHLLAKRSIVSLNKLSREKFIFLGPKTGLYDLCIEICSKAGFIPNVYPDLDIRLETIKEFVLKNLGVSLLMKKTAIFLKDPRIKIIRLKEKPKSTLAIISQNNSLPKEHIKFIKYASNYFIDIK